MKTCPECFNDYGDEFDVCPDDSTRLKYIEQDPLIGTVLDERYLIDSVVGRGGMGVVYKAHQQNMDKEMAIKMLYSHKVAEPEAIKRFHREAKTVSQVRHHHIINLYDFGMYQGQPYLVMDFLEGKSLKSVLKDEGPLAFERAGKIFDQVLQALASAHSCDVVHRDMKPENIMLSRQNNQEDWVTIVDFGLSKLKEASGINDEQMQVTKVGDVCGSPPYMSPEQCLSSLVVDPRSDLYSLGIVIYECLSGKLPFTAKSAIEMLDCHLYTTPIPFNSIAPEFKVCTEVARVLKKALDKDPERRYQSAEEFQNDLREAIRRDGVKVRAMRHREEVAQFHGLIEEAQAMQRASQELDVPAGYEADEIEEDAVSQPVSTEQALKTTVDAPALTQSALSDLQTDDGALSSSGAHLVQPSPLEMTDCQYCGAPVQAELKFCPNCERQMSSQEARGLSTPRSRSGSGRSHRPTEQNVAFSSRAKTASERISMYNIAQRLLTALLLAVALYGFYVASTNAEVLKSINRLVASLTK